MLHHIIQTYVPTSLIVTISWFNFWLDWKVYDTDVVTLEKSLGCGLEDKLKEMCKPAEITENSVLFVLEDEMYYDGEFDDDKWVRVMLRGGDLIVGPKGSYYRTMLTPTDSFEEIYYLHKHLAFWYTKRDSHDRGGNLAKALRCFPLMCKGHSACSDMGLDLLYVLNCLYGNQLPLIIGAVLYPIYSKFPNWMLAMFYFIFAHTFQANNFVSIFILLNRLTAIIMPTKHEKLWRRFLPFITIFVYLVPILTCWPAFKMNTIVRLNDPNSTTGRTFSITEAGDAQYITNYMIRLAAAFTVIFLILCVLLNICTFVAYKLHMENVSINGNNNFDDIKKKLLFYALTTFVGHALVASLLLIPIITNIDVKKTLTILYIYLPLVMESGTVVLSSCLLLWASGTFRQQLIKDFSIIRKTNNQNIRVGAMDGPQNNNHRPVGGAVCHQMQNRFSSSVQQLPTISSLRSLLV